MFYVVVYSDPVVFGSPEKRRFASLGTRLLKRIFLCRQCYNMFRVDLSVRSGCERCYHCPCRELSSLGRRSPCSAFCCSSRYSLVNGTGAIVHELCCLCPWLCRRTSEQSTQWNPRSSGRDTPTLERTILEAPIGSSTKRWTGALRAMETSICCPGPLVVSLFGGFSGCVCVSG